MAFQAKIIRARWVLGPFTSEDMETIGNVVLDSMYRRITNGFNANDAPSKALKPGKNGKRGYPERKAARGLQPVRDWFFSGRTMRSMKVKSASENKVVIGFINANADRVAHINNLRERSFGVSPKDRLALNAIVLATLKRSRVISVRKAA
jgi:hypothetical protein